MPVYRPTVPDDRARILLRLYEQMLLIREAEGRLGRLFRDGKIPGFIHVSTGQEAIAVGVASALRSDDTVASTHRGHGHALAKGMKPAALFHEIIGNDEGPCRGRGGSLHVADLSVGMLGANGIVGAGIPIAAGSALAHKTLRNARVAVGFFGDGAQSEGVLYETLNLAKLWKLPLLLVCEHNGWSEFSPSSAQYTGSLEALCATFGVTYRKVDGNDVEVVREAATALVGALRGGLGPAVLECQTLRVHGHYEGDPQTYRKGMAEPPAADPVELAVKRLDALKIPAGELAGVKRRVADRSRRRRRR
jgi:TPP-dependent pyruvate/acetoin dehydrogenase alpha subunit